MMITDEHVLHGNLENAIYEYLNNSLGNKEDIISLIDRVVDEIEFTLSLCSRCHSMTKTVNGKCDRCGGD